MPQSGYIHTAGYIHGVDDEAGTSASSRMALLAYLNSFTCDWWSRRIVDRHVTAPVINNLLFRIGIITRFSELMSLPLNSLAEMELRQFLVESYQMEMMVTRIGIIRKFVQKSRDLLPAGLD